MPGSSELTWFASVRLLYLEEVVLLVTVCRAKKIGVRLAVGCIPGNEPGGNTNRLFLQVQRSESVTRKGSRQQIHSP